MESKHRKCRESNIIYHYTSHKLAYAPLYNKSSIYGKGMTTLLEGMSLNTVQLFSLLHLEHMSMRPYATRHWICNHSRWFDSWGWFPSLSATTNIGTCIQKPQESDNCYLLMFLLHSLKQFQCLMPSGNMPASILHPWKLKSKFWRLGQWAFTTQPCCAWAVFLSRMLYIPLARTELLSSHIPTKIGGLQWLVAVWWSLVAILVGSKNRDTCSFQQEEIIKFEQQKVQESWVPQAAKLKQLNQLHQVCEVWSSSWAKEGWVP